MDRIFIHIDLDSYYCQVEQAQNPSLVNLPFGIQQKHIIVTANYPARASGVKKLQLLADAKKACPGLIIINGEDIQRYRDASKQVFRHVRAIFGSKVQRLGMDEIWIDVTDHIAGHDRCPAGSTQFQLGGHFIEHDNQPSGHVLGQAGHDEVDAKLILASHIAAFTRESIRREFSFTSSAGICTSKIIAKLVGDVKKPNNQTVIFPCFHQEFMDSVQIKKIAGVGYAFLKVLYAKLSEEPAPPPRTVELPVDDLDAEDEELFKDNIEVEDDADDDDFKVTSKEKEAFLTSNPQSLTVRQVRKQVDLSTLISWFGTEKGKWLWDILHARDDSQIVESLLQPKSIGVEDSFLHCTSIEEVSTRLLDLTTDLVTRMENDLKENGAWVKYPRNLRLTPRFRNHTDAGRSGEVFRHKRVSRSAPLPVDAFASHLTPANRAAKLVSQVLLPMFRKLCSDKSGWDLSLLNVGVSDFENSRPSTIGISDYFDGTRSTISPSDQCPPGLDESVWTSLSPDIKKDVLNDLKRRALADDISPDAKRIAVARDEDDFADIWEADEQGHLCTICSSVIPMFAVDDHVCR